MKGGGRGGGGRKLMLGRLTLTLPIWLPGTPLNQIVCRDYTSITDGLWGKNVPESKLATTENEEMQHADAANTEQ